MFDRFDIWQYRDDSNCWDFVREFLIERSPLKKEDLPKFGVLCTQNKKMTSCHNEFIKSSNMTYSPPRNFAIGCQYVGDTLFHVGVVYDGHVRHVGKKCGAVRDTIERFERRAPKTKYWLHPELWPY